MGFFSFDFDRTKGHIEISDQGWVWFACTLPLTALTLGLSYLWVWLKDPIRQNHVTSLRDIASILKTDRRKPPTPNITTQNRDVTGIAEFLASLRKGEKGK
jgi:hypothetical protein